MELLICASERMRQTMPKEGRIHVIACDGRIEKMMDGFFSGQKIHGRYLIKNKV